MIMAVKHTYEVRPGTILAVGIEDITDRYIFRAVLMEAIKAAADHVELDDIDYELRTVYDMMVSD